MKQSAAPPALRHLESELERLAEAELLRERPAPLAPPYRTFCSNDYLGLAVDGPAHPAASEGTAAAGTRAATGTTGAAETADTSAGTARTIGKPRTLEAPSSVAETRARAELDETGGTFAVGAGASRLVSGERAEHVALEEAVASWLGVEGALVFASGYAANVGTLAALASPGDVVVSDALNHASIIDGCRLSRATVVVVPHLDVAAVAEALARPTPRAGGRRWVVTESYFGMDADTPDLAALRGACDAAGAALIVDEAHALGVLGPEGRGACALAGVAPDVLIGTFGKALGQAGAFVAGCDVLVRWLWNRARSFVFSTGVSPLVAAASTRAVARTRAANASRERVLALAERLRRSLAERGVPALGYGHVVPVLVGDPRAAVAASRLLSDRGFHVQPIRPPTVPAGSSRLRLSVTARHSAEELDALADAVRDALSAARQPSHL